ncbi:MAG: glycosyltransferase family 4 protein [Actinomycetota bacterium]|nr:glycosyltransferase family 4 protein [Actinomycetota bacterium]
MTTVHFVVPDGIDDPEHPSGGNVYDRRLCVELRLRGWDVREHAAPGSWPYPELPARQSLERQIAGVPDGQLLLVDGLIASTMPAVLVPAARRLRLVVLVHQPLGNAAERPDAAAQECAVLSAARTVLTTSSWCRRWLLSRYPLCPDRVTVAEPGTDPAGLAVGTAGGGELLCVGTVSPSKGHNLLLTALAAVADLRWRCICVGTLDRDPAFVVQLRQRLVADGLGDRVHFIGPRTGADLERLYGAADALVHPSRAETYGMVITEALAHGLPVLAADVGGVGEALGRVSRDRRPGLLIAPGDPDALAGALRRWLVEPKMRTQLRAAALERRATLPGWDATADRIAGTLGQVAA